MTRLQYIVFEKGTLFFTLKFKKSVKGMKYKALGAWDTNR